MKFASMNVSDKQRIEHIIMHYEALLVTKKSLETEELSDTRKKELKNSIYMDLFQMGEHANKLSKEVQSLLPHHDIKGIIDTRNFIGHDYVSVKENMIWDTINKECPRLIEELKKLF